MFDMTSLLLGAAISGGALCLTMLVLMTTEQTSHFKINWSIGAGLLVCHVFAYWFYARGGPFAVGVIACALQSVAVAFVFASVRQFMDDDFKPLRQVLWVSVPYLLIVPPIFAFGYDGLALVLQNAVTASLLISGGVVYLRNRQDAPVALGFLAGLYLLAGFSFALCGLVLLVEGQWSIGHAPQNWAEDLNVVISLLGISGAGALTLSVDQARLARVHHQTAMKDPLTGLLNRRGLAASHRGMFGANKAVVLFDLDHFKRINDRHGHATGDLVIRKFADTLRQFGRSMDQKARLGGEEFAMVMEGVSSQQARQVAERIAAVFGEIEMISEAGESFLCTVSAGIGFGDQKGATVDEVTARADRALYTAKSDGRNRVVTGELRLAS